MKRELCPIKAFAEDAHEHLKKALQQGYETILSIDANENMRVGRLETLFKSLGLVETTGELSVDAPPNTFISGKNQIDAV